MTKEHFIKDGFRCDQHYKGITLNLRYHNVSAAGTWQFQLLRQLIILNYKISPLLIDLLPLKKPMQCIPRFFCF